MWWVATGGPVAQRGPMIRPQVSNAVIYSILFSVLAGGGMMLVTGQPAARRAADEVVRRCEMPRGGQLSLFLGSDASR